MGGKAKNGRGDREFTRVQELSHENKRLKREIDRLRKQLRRPQESECEDCQDRRPAPEIVETRGPDRTCYNCREHRLVMIKYSKGADLWYIRACPGCKYKTRGKRYEPGVRD